MIRNATIEEMLQVVFSASLLRALGGYIIVIHLDLLACSSEPLRVSILKEGAVGAVGEWSPQENLSHKKTSQAGTSKRKER
jgi:hypothetical protein